MFYHDLSDEAKETNFALLEPIVMGETTLPLTNTCWDSSVPKTYIITTDDRAIEPSLQRSMVEQMKNGTWYIETMHTGHSPWLKDQPTVIRIIKDAVQRALE
jgi:pimeloyl-ACP methyl ester carboxylesterase